MTQTEEFMSRVVQHLTDLREEIAKVWTDGRVAHVAFELTPGARKLLELSPGATVWTLPRSRERRAAEMADAVTARFVDGKRPYRVWLWAHAGSSLLLTFGDGGWKIVPGSTDAGRARGES